MKSHTHTKFFSWSLVFEWIFFFFIHSNWNIFILQQFFFLFRLFGRFSCSCFVVLSPQPASIHTKWISYLIAHHSRNVHVPECVHCSFSHVSLSVDSYFSIGRPKTKLTESISHAPTISKWISIVFDFEVIQTNIHRKNVLKQWNVHFYQHIKRYKLKRC